MALVINYGLQVQTLPNFSINFSIPNNCDYSVRTTSKIHYITVSLNKGQTIPSNVYVACSVNFSAIDDNLDVYFEQILNNTTATKPKLSIVSC